MQSWLLCKPQLLPFLLIAEFPISATKTALFTLSGIPAHNSCAHTFGWAWLAKLL